MGGSGADKVLMCVLHAAAKSGPLLRLRPLAVEPRHGEDGDDRGRTAGAHLTARRHTGARQRGLSPDGLTIAVHGRGRRGRIRRATGARAIVRISSLGIVVQMIMLRSFHVVQVAYLMLGLAIVSESIRQLRRAFPPSAPGTPQHSGHAASGA